MEPEIKSNYDNETSEHRHRKRNSRLDYLWMIPLYVLQKTVAWLVKYPYIMLALLILFAATTLISRLRSTSSVKIEQPAAIEATVNQIQSIREIGQWESLAIECEEMVDTFEEHFFGDKNLVRIYTGTLRLGVDLRKVQDNWVTTRRDTAILRLPSITLLNPDFIDEARTRTFIEKGTWNAATNEALYRKARREMLRRSYTDEQRRQAAHNIIATFESMFHAFGYKHIDIYIESYNKAHRATHVRHTHIK